MQSLKEQVNALKKDLLSLMDRQPSIRYEYKEGVATLEATHQPEPSSKVKEEIGLPDNREKAIVEVLQTVTFPNNKGQNTLLNPRGTVTVRSNVTVLNLDPDLIPGNVLRRYFLLGEEEKITRRQSEEMRDYLPCSICKRTIFQINEEGCDYPICRKQGIPSKAEMLARKSNVD